MCSTFPEKNIGDVQPRAEKLRRLKPAVERELRVAELIGNFLKAMVVILLTFSLGMHAAKADEGTNDPDFDYLPPDEFTIFSRLRDFTSDLFIARSHSGSYQTAKRRLYNEIGDVKSFYCGCEMEIVSRTFDRSSCGYAPRNDNDRARRIEAEHVVPAYWIAHFHADNSCWASDESCGSARECCLKNDDRFETAHNDLVNLFPAIGELNADRSNLIYGLIDEEGRNYGMCDFEINADDRVSEPKDDIRGDIARVYFYMRDSYQLDYPEQLQRLLNKWNDVDPVSPEERSRNSRIQDAQGTSNSLVGY